MEFPLYVVCCFSLAVFNIHSLCLAFVSLINMYLGVFLLEFTLYRILYASWTWLTISFSMLGKFSMIISSKIFSYPFLFLFSNPMIRMLVHLILPQRSLRLLSSFHYFYFILLFRSYSPFHLPAQWFVLLRQIFCYWFFLEYF